MYTVKSELDKNNVCFGCLSTFRTVKPLKTHLDLFHVLLEQQPVYNAIIFLCWECKALLRKTWMFKKRIQQAQFILQQSIWSVDTCTELSTLSITKKDSYDHIVQYEEIEKQYVNNFDNQETLELNNIEEENVYNEKSELEVKNELDEDFYDDVKLENDYSTEPEGSESKIENSETSTIKNKITNKNDEDEDYVPNYKIKGKTKFFDAYTDKVTVADASGIDIDDLRKYCVRVTLTDDEIEEMLNREHKDIRQGIRKDRPYQCNNCENSYKREMDYRRHITFNHLNKPIGRTQCRQCKKSCQTFAMLQEHWSQYHNQYFRCSMCGLTMARSTAVAIHVETTHSKKYICNECNEPFSSMKEFRRHYKSRHERMICDDCGKTFIKKRSFETHYKRHHMPPTCEVCNKSYTHYQNLDNHYRLNHPEFINCENRRELAYCVECNKQFPSVYKYRRHLASAAVHTPPKVEIVPCPECGKVFSRKIRMTNHVMSVHKKNTKHRCDICNKTFCSAYSAKTHRQCVHEKVPMPKNKFCDICGRGFSTNRILSNHRRTHTGERPYACSHCPATFAQRVAMITHSRTQHKNVHERVADIPLADK